jgi:hypothetical protein
MAAEPGAWGWSGAMGRCGEKPPVEPAKCPTPAYADVAMTNASVYNSVAVGVGGAFP